MNEPTTTRGLRRFAIVPLLVVGLALAPGYLLLCGHASGKKEAACEMYRAGTKDAPGQTLSTEIAMTKDMNPLGLNVIAKTPFRDYARAETGLYQGELTYDGKPLWTSKFYLSHAHKKEALSGTTFTLRMKTFQITRDGKYQFALTLPADMNNIQCLDIEVRRNTSIPNPWVVGLGIVLLLGVMVWALIPAKGHDHKAERTGTQWYAD
jgi:hypothetical protein